MSCNYADGLSPYENKGVLGLAEKFDSAQKLKEKCNILAGWIQTAKHVVIHTGAGISTAAGIPDFRGPNGVWTLERDGRKPEKNISFSDAEPTKTHMAIKTLVENKFVHFVISQNIDGLHLKSGLPRTHLAELHGNMFIEQCNVCCRQFIRTVPVETVGQKPDGRRCRADSSSGRPCRGQLHDNILDWEHNLPEKDLDMADMHSSIADLSICLGTTLQIVPSGNLPLNTVKYGGKLAVCNLQSTKHDNKADLIINHYVDDILTNIMENLNIQIGSYSQALDPTRTISNIEWTVPQILIKELEKIYKSKCKGVRKKRSLIKRKNEDVPVASKINVKAEKYEPCNVAIEIEKTDPA